MNAHCESLDIWCYESISAHSFKDSKSIDLNQIEDKQLESTSKLTESSLISKSSIYEIDNVSNYFRKCLFSEIEILPLGAGRD